MAGFLGPTYEFGADCRLESRHGVRDTVPVTGGPARAWKAHMAPPVLGPSIANLTIVSTVKGAVGWPMTGRGEGACAGNPPGFSTYSESRPTRNLDLAPAGVEGGGAAGAVGRVCRQREKGSRGSSRSRFAYTIFG